VTHALAIEHAMREGFATYDFMAGENRLKASFASHWSDMIWLGVQGPSASRLAPRLAGWRRWATEAWRRRQSPPSEPAAAPATLGPQGSD
jgi:hypothetical protein